MIDTYETLKRKKEMGAALDWSTITKEQLERLFYDDNIPDSIIADLYDVEHRKVTYKRRKWGIKLYNGASFVNAIKRKEEGPLTTLNEIAKQDLMQPENINLIARALTHYVFREGPVEDMHVKHQLSQSDMKTLNKYMVNQIASLLTLLYNNEWYKLRLVLKSYARYGSNWDEPEINNEIAETLFDNDIKKL